MMSDDTIITIDAGDFFTAEGWHYTAIAADLGITPDTTDDILRAIATREVDAAAAQGQIVTDTYDYLRALRDRLRADA